jgi:acetyl esterase/lipase
LVTAIAATLLVGVFGVGAAQCISPIDSGFGASGRCDYTVDTLNRSYFGTGRTFVYRPTNAPARCPVVFLLPRFGADSPEEYEPILHHCASRGWLVVYPPEMTPSLKRNELEKYRYFLDAYRNVALKYGDKVDTSRIGIVGHGFGGGAALAIMRALVATHGWGDTAAFMYIMAPWYVHAIDSRELANFPRNVKTVVQVFADDNINDPRIALDLYRSLGIPDSSKRFIVCRSDTWDSCIQQADDYSPLGDSALGGTEDAMDWYGILRPLDALAAWSFGHDASGARVFGSGIGTSELFMGRWPDGVAARTAVITANPRPYINKGPYVNTNASPRNPRADLTPVRKSRKVFFNHMADVVKLLAQRARSELLEIDTSDYDVMPNPILSGCGADGRCAVAIESLTTEYSPDNAVYFYHPRDSVRPLPTVFFVPGYGSSDPRTYEPLFMHIVSRGYGLVFSPYPLMPVVDGEETVMAKYRLCWQGFLRAREAFGTYIDTTRVGFMGQSFGGGAVPWMAYRALVDRKWGARGAFMYMTAPWYVFGLTQKQLQTFPDGLNMVVEVFDEDAMNDHQMAVDIFNSINVPPSRKDFLTLHSDSLGGYVMMSNHYVPYGSHEPNGRENLLDYYGMFKVVDALADYTWAGSEEARNVALGHGSREQRFMGEWTDARAVRLLDVTGTPRATHPQLGYTWAWDNKVNPRR